MDINNIIFLVLLIIVFLVWFFLFYRLLKFCIKVPNSDSDSEPNNRPSVDSVITLIDF